MAKFEPEDGTIYSGAGQCMESIAAMVHSVPADRKPVLIALYEGLSSGDYWRNPDILEAHNAFPGAILQIGLQLPLHNANDLQAIGDGRYDRQLAEMAEVYRSIKLPVFMRIGYEFDGEWNGYEPRAYKKAYRRIVNAFRESGAENVAFVWNTYIADNRSIMDWYPDNPETGERDGDRYVDWFAFNTITPNFDAAWFMELAAAHGKPVMIGESSYAIVPPTYAFQAFLQDFKNMMIAHGVKGFQYINWEWQVYPEQAGWHTWANGRYTEDSDRVPLFNAWLADKRFLFRDAAYHQPIALLVDCARALKPSDGDGRSWDKSFDHCTQRDGYDYRAEGAIVRYGDGWSPYWEGESGEIAIELNLPAGQSGFVILNMNIGNGAFLDRSEEYALCLEDREYRLLLRKGGYHKIPISNRSKNSDQPLTVRIANKHAGGAVRVAQFGFWVLAENPLQAPANVYVEDDGGRRRIRWEPVSGAFLYNIYKDNQLMDMTDRNEFIDDRPGERPGVYQVSAYGAHRGEGSLSAPGIGKCRAVPIVSKGE